MTVGFVLVSHSPRLAEGTRELAEQVAHGAPIVAVGGAEDGSLGTNALAIADAVESLAAADGVEGVLVLMVLGILLMVNPFSLALYGAGFPVLLVGLIAFIVVSHF